MSASFRRGLACSFCILFPVIFPEVFANMCGHFLTSTCLFFLAHMPIGNSHSFPCRGEKTILPDAIFKLSDSLLHQLFLEEFFPPPEMGLYVGNFLFQRESDDMFLFQCYHRTRHFSNHPLRGATHE